MALIPDPVECVPIPVIEGCLASFIQAQLPEGLAALGSVLGEMKNKADSEFKTVCARIDGLTAVLAPARDRSDAIEELCNLISGIKENILAFREELLATQGIDCPELLVIEALIDIFKASLLAEAASLNIPGTESILGDLNALKASLECQSGNLDRLLSFMGG